MKKSINFVGLLGGSMVLLLSGVALLSINSSNPVEVKATSGPVLGNALITSNINLNDNADDDIRSYYANLDSLGDEELSGTNLLKNLRPIIHDLTYYSYANVWKIYEITDRDWVDSPAESNSSLGISYNESTNVFTSYKYGTSTGSGKHGSNPYVRPLYRNRNENGTIVEGGKIGAWDDHQATGINREHVWCQSRGFKAPSEAEGPAGTDVHHLIAGDGYVNQSIHNNYTYGNVDTTRAYDDGGTKYSYDAGNLLGYPTYAGVTNGNYKVFEPQDSDKGDIARAIFYMAACYNNYSGTETISQYDPYLTIIDDSYNADAGSVISNSTTPVAMGILHDLLEWHELDPVDEYEIHRNNLIYNNYQHNRNPFIDFPQWVECIWGDSSSVGIPHGLAKPALDKINGADKPLIVSTKSITMDIEEVKEISATTSDGSEIAWHVGYYVDDKNIVTLSKNHSASGEAITIQTIGKKGTTTIEASATVDGVWVHQLISVTITMKEKAPSTSLDTKTIIIIAAIAVAALILLIIILALSKKARKKAKKVVKKAVKKSVKKSSSSSKKKK